MNQIRGFKVRVMTKENKKEDFKLVETKMELKRWRVGTACNFTLENVDVQQNLQDWVKGTR